MTEPHHRTEAGSHRTLGKSELVTRLVEGLTLELIGIKRR